MSNRIYKTLGTVAIEPKGEYDSTAYYEKLNVVTYQGSSYMAKQNVNNVLPTNEQYWLYLGGGVKKIDTIQVYDNVASMKADSTLEDGMSVQTLGYHSKNDNGGALYKIRTITSDDTIDEMVIIALQDNTLVAELINNENINVKQFGAKGDGNNDDTLSLKRAIKYVCDLTTGTGWKHTRTIYIPNGKYKISSSLIDQNTNITLTSFKFKGDNMYSTSIICDENVDYVFNDNIYFGFTIFEDISFIGNNQNMWLNFVGGGNSSSQSLKINKCSFNRFKTIINASGPTMCSEVTFFESKIVNCGTSNNPCALFILNNSQAVNWRFYSTDIEQNVGSHFKYLRGANISYFQGSIIPFNGSKVIDLTDSDQNYFGSGNSPHLIMYGVRFELRENSYLYYKSGNTRSWFNAIFNDCGMGGANLTLNDFYCIDLGRGGSNLIFNNCYNMANFKVTGNINTENATNITDRLVFNNCDISARNLIENSNITYTGTNTGFCPIARIDDINYSFVNKLSIHTTMKYQEKIIASFWGNEGLNIKQNNQPKTFTSFANCFVKDINIIGLPRTGFDGYTFTVTLYDDNDSIIDSVTGNINDRNNLTIHVGRRLNNIKLVTDSSYTGTSAVFKGLVISATML